jgi:hypothetical protein
MPWMLSAVNLELHMYISNRCCDSVVDVQCSSRQWDCCANIARLLVRVMAAAARHPQCGRAAAWAPCTTMHKLGCTLCDTAVVVYPNMFCNSLIQVPH